MLTADQNDDDPGGAKPALPTFDLRVVSSINDYDLTVPLVTYSVEAEYSTYAGIHAIVHDLDGDGYPDLAAAQRRDSPSNGHEVQVWFGPWDHLTVPEPPDETADTGATTGTVGTADTGTTSPPGAPVAGDTGTAHRPDTAWGDTAGSTSSPRGSGTEEDAGACGCRAPVPSSWSWLPTRRR